MSKKGDVTRRDFLGGAAKAAAGVAAGTTAVKAARADVYKSILPQTVIGANEKIRTGHIGVGSMGTRDLQFVMLRDDLQPIHVCDLAPQLQNRAEGIISQKYPAPLKTSKFEEVIANKDVDAVVIVTPDHWHTIPTLMAIDAGKDVYCEKPLCTTIEEARVLKDKINGSKQVYQSGTMQRSGKYFQEAVQMIKDGYIGKIGRVECWNNDESTVAGIGNPKDPKPDWLDWDRYIGWTPKVEYNKNRYVYNFRWFTDYSGGKITDWGAHLLDIAIWAMGEEKEPKRITAAGGNLILEDNRTTPDTIDVLWEFDNYVLSFSNRAWNPDWVEKSPGHGIFFHGTLGSMRVDRTGYKVFPFRANGGCEPKEITDAVEMDMNTGHWEDFVKCVRDRSKPICNIDVAYRTALICLTGKCTYLANAKLGWDAENVKFKGADSEAVKIANEWAYRPYQNGWSLKPPYYDKW